MFKKKYILIQKKCIIDTFGGIMESNIIECYIKVIRGLKIKLTKYDSIIEFYFFYEKENKWLPAKKETLEKKLNIVDLCFFMYNNSNKIIYINSDVDSIKTIYDVSLKKITSYITIKNNNTILYIDYLQNFDEIIINSFHYTVDYFIKNFIKIFDFLLKTDNNYIIIKNNNIYSVEGNKVGLKFDDDLFFIDMNFLNIVNVVFNNKIYTYNNFEEFKDAIYNFIVGYNTNVETTNIVYTNNATVILTIENNDKDFYFTEPHFEIEVPYDFDSFIKSKTIIKILKGRIGNHYKVWEGNIYKFEIEYKGRKEILYL